MKTIRRHSYIGSKVNFFALLSALVLMGGLATGIVLTQQQQLNRSEATNDGPVLSMIPAQKILALDENATFAVTLDTNGKHASIAQLEIAFDTTALKNVTFTPGTILPQQIPADNLTIADGKIKITLAVQPGSPFTGTGILGTISVRAKAEKDSALSFTQNTIVLVTRTSDNALASATGATITAPASSTPEPSSTPGPSITPNPTEAPPTSTSTPTGGAGTLNCDTKCFGFKNPQIITTCINLCYDINAGTKRCPSACSNVPKNFETLCSSVLCPGR